MANDEIEERFVSLDTLAGGAGVEMFNDELHNALENILDPNTKATAVRTVTLVLTIKPDENRKFSNALVEARSKLAPVRGVSIPMYIGKKGGRAVASERDIRQLEMLDNVKSINDGKKGGK